MNGNEKDGQRKAPATIETQPPTATAVPGKQTLIEANAKNGVTASADAQVARAAASTGAPLEPTMQRKFEGSLGVDLTGVRVHTGPEAADAAASVTAKAYTLGNDIYFGAGQYSPGTADGERLLAHEVAHTVQQEGRGQAPQFKLEVSTPGDFLEDDADRAAEAMIAGREASPARGVALARQVLQREPSPTNSDQLTKQNMQGAKDTAADAQQSAAEQAAADQANPPPVARVDNVTEVSKAQELKARIESFDANMQKGIADGKISAEQYAANAKAISALETFIAQSGEQGRTLTSFQPQVLQCKQDFAALSGAVTKFQSVHGAPADQPGATPNQDGQSAATSLVEQASGGGSIDDMSERVQQMAAKNPMVQTAFGNVQLAKKDLDAAANTLPQAQMDMDGLVHGAMAAADNIAAGLSQRKSTDDKDQKDLATLQQQITEVKGAVDMIIGALSGTVTAAMTAAGLPAKAGAAATKVATMGLDAAIDAHYAPAVNKLQGRIKQADAKAEWANEQQQIELLQQAQAQMKAQSQKVNNAVADLVRAKNAEKTAMDMFIATVSASSAGGGANGDISQVAEFLGLADRFVAQVDATIGLGEAEQQAASSTDKSRGSLNDADNKQGLEYYEPYQQWYGDLGGPSLKGVQEGGGGRLSWGAMQQRILIDHNFGQGYTGGKSNEGSGVNPSVEEAMTELKQMKDEAIGFRTVANKALGFTDNPSGRPAGAGPTPSGG
jgi:hypothetical protein